MNSDGGNKTLIVIGGYVAVLAIPSRPLRIQPPSGLSGPTRITGQDYRNGPEKRSLRQRDDTLIAVQLTDDPTLESSTARPGDRAPVPGDGLISFKARRWCRPPSPA